MHEDDLHAQHPLRPLSPRRLVATIGGALALIVLVVVASHGDRPSGGSGGGQTASTVLVNVVLLVLAIVAAAMVVTTLLSFQPVRQVDPKPRTGPRLFGQIMAFILIIGIVVAAVQFFRGDGSGQQQNAPAGQRAGPLLKDLDKNKKGSRQSVDWLPVALVFGGAVVAFAAAGVVMLRRGPLPPSETSLTENLAALFDETLADLEAERDPRRAVIAAYARMERILGRHGLPRRPAEAPHEYVSRVLEDLISSGSSVRRLTRLFERAKFSPHAVDPQMKEQAITAVAAVRDELHAREAEALIAAPH